MVTRSISSTSLAHGASLLATNCVGEIDHMMDIDAEIAVPCFNKLGWPSNILFFGLWKQPTKDTGWIGVPNKTC